MIYYREQTITPGTPLKGGETGPTVYLPYPRGLESLAIYRCNLQRQHFLFIYFKIMNVYPAGALNPRPTRGVARSSSN